MGFQFEWYTGTKKCQIMVKEENTPNWVCVFESDNAAEAEKMFEFIRTLSKATCRVHLTGYARLETREAYSVKAQL